MPSEAASPLPSGAALGIGTTATLQELSRFVAIPPDGAGLPTGSGSVAQGRAIYAAKCAMCHGDALQGVKASTGRTRASSAEPQAAKKSR